MVINPKLTRLSVQVILLGLAIVLYFKPYYNWDILPYMVLAKSSPSVPFHDAYQEVLLEARHHIPRQDWDALLARHPELTRDAASFQTILKYFEIKPLYLLTVKFFNVLGFNLVTSSLLPSTISYFLIALILFWWLQKSLPLGLASSITLLAALSSFMVDPARYSSPDMMAALFSFGGIFLVLESALVPGLIICGTAIFIRPDTILLFMLIVWASHRSGKIKLSLAVMISLTALILLATIIQPWLLTEFLFTTYDYSADWSMQEMLMKYAAGLRGGIHSVIQSSFPLFGILICIALYLNPVKEKIHGGVWPFLMAGMVCIFIIRYFLHPVVEDRFLISFYLLILVGFSKALGSLKYES